MIREQRKRFAGYGIEYEVWPAPKLRNKLRSQKGIVSTYCKPEAYWILEICGEVLPVHTGSEGSKGHITVNVDVALANKIEQLSSKLSDEIDRQLEQSRVALQEGRKDAAGLWVKAVKADGQLWADLSPQVKAKILVFEAILTIDTAKNIELVKKLADEAQTIDPNVVQHRLRALITYKERGPNEAIKILAGHEDIDSINLKAAFLLEMGEAEQSLSILSFES
jgi:hypothetical protein